MSREFFNEDTGEVSKEPPFVKMYIEHVGRIKGLTGLQVKVWYFMMENMNNRNEVSYGMRSKRYFLNMHGTSNSSFNNSIKGLIENGLIKRIGKGEFLVNKKYAVKVPWDQVKTIEWTKKYTRDGFSEHVVVS